MSGSSRLPAPFGWRPSPPDWGGPRLGAYTLSGQYNLSKVFASSVITRSLAPPDASLPAGWKEPLALLDSGHQAILDPAPQPLQPEPGRVRSQVEARLYGKTVEGRASGILAKGSQIATLAQVGTAWVRFFDDRNKDSERTWAGFASTSLQTGVAVGTEAGPAVLARLGLIGAKTAARAGLLMTGVLYLAGVGMAYDHGMRDRGWTMTRWRRHGRHPVPGHWVGGKGRPGAEVLAAPIVQTWGDVKYLWDALSTPTSARPMGRGGRRLHGAGSAGIPKELQRHLAEWVPRIQADAEAVKRAEGSAADWAKLQLAIDLQGYWGCTRQTRRLYVSALADEYASYIALRGPRNMRPRKDELRKAIKTYLIWTSGLSHAKRPPWQRVPEAQRTYLAMAGLLPKKLVHGPRRKHASMTPAERRRMILARHGVSSAPVPSASVSAGSGSYSGSSGSTTSSSSSASSSASGLPWERYGISKAQWLAWKGH